MQFSCELVCSTEVNACFLKKPQGGLDFCVEHCFGNNLCFKFVMPAPDSQQKKKYVFLWLNNGDYFEWVNLAVVQVPSFSLFGTFVICIKTVWKLQWVTGSPVQGETGCEGGISTFWRITLFLFRVTKWMYLSVLQTNTFLVWQPAAPSTCSAVSNLLNNFTWGLSANKLWAFTPPLWNRPPWVFTTSCFPPLPSVFHRSASACPASPPVSDQLLGACSAPQRWSPPLTAVLPWTLSVVV